MNKKVFKINIPKGLTHSREWEIDEIKVHVINDFTASITYKKYIVNAEKYRIVIRLNWLERRKGLTLESKIKQRLKELKLKLENENIKIREYKRIEKSFE